VGEETARAVGAIVEVGRAVGWRLIGMEVCVGWLTDAFGVVQAVRRRKTMMDFFIVGNYMPWYVET
jgi:hypothetical protein